MIKKFVIKCGITTIEDAVERAITECITEGILKDFLTKCRSEAKKMSIYEYDEERQRRFDRLEGMEAGMKAGIQKGESRFAALTKALMEDDMTKELSRAVTDTEYRKELYNKYVL